VVIVINDRLVIAPMMVLYRSSHFRRQVDTDAEGSTDAILGAHDILVISGAEILDVCVRDGGEEDGVHCAGNAGLNVKTERPLAVADEQIEFLIHDGIRHGIATEISE
jgi:hypothetical protein